MWQAISYDPSEEDGQKSLSFLWPDIHISFVHQALSESVLGMSCED